MGLKQKRRLDNGFDVEYAKIASIELRGNGKVEVTLAWYKDVDIRFTEDSTAAYYERVECEASDALLKEVYKAIKADLYPKAKDVDPDHQKSFEPESEGATDEKEAEE